MTGGRWPAAALVAGLVVAACTDGGAEPGRSVGPIETTVEDGPAEEATPATTASDEPVGTFTCEAVEIGSGGQVQRAELIEASGVVASGRHEDVLWTHNDSGQSTGIYGLSTSGEDLGYFQLVDGDGPIEAVDVEDIAIRGDTIYLADIGDNLRQRSSVRIYLFDEPTPGADGTVQVRSVITAGYPDGPTDAEALLVDPVDGELLVLSKDLDDGEALTRLYSLSDVDSAADDGDPVDGDPAVMDPVGSLDVAALTARSSVFSVNGLLFPGSVTGADVHPDGDLIAIRTYGTVWLFPRTPDRTLAQALGAEPCEGPVAAEAQGESVGFLPDRDGDLGDGATVRYITISEGSNPPVNAATVLVGDG